MLQYNYYIPHLSTSAKPAVDVSVSGEAIYLNPFNMTCRASLNAKVASQLIQFLVLDWVMEDGGSVSNIATGSGN